MLKLTRAELHALVWSKPMTEIAREYGVRDQYVAKACDTHDVARPRAGHWQRMLHGRAIETTALDNSHFSPDEIIIVNPLVGTTARQHRAGDNDAVRRRAA